LCGSPEASSPLSLVRGVVDREGIAMDKKEAVLAIIDTLAEKWPNAFFTDPTRRRPLKVGVHLDILEALPGVNKKTLSTALRFYARHLSYMQAVAEGQARVDLNGAEVGPVSERDREMAAAELRKGTAKQEREAEARRAADEKYSPSGPNAAKPRLSLRKVTP
jgi:sRNA-binding protein